MANERRKYTEEFKREAVQLMESSDKAVAEIARDLGINDNNLYHWRGEYSHQNPPLVNGSQSEIEAELKQLRRELEVLPQERDILRKAMSIVSRSQP